MFSDLRLGLIIDLGATLAASRLIGTMLFQIDAHNPLTFGLTTLLLAVVALAARLLPARRATRVNPSKRSAPSDA